MSWLALYSFSPSLTKRMNPTAWCTHCETHPCTPGHAFCSRTCARASRRRGSGLISRIFSWFRRPTAPTSNAQFNPQPYIIPASSAYCALPGCTALAWVGRNGKRSDYCSRTHKARGETCAFKDCQRKVYIDPTTRVRSRYCDRGHSIDARQGQAVRPIMKIEIINGMQPYNTPMAPAPVRDAATCQYDGCTRNTRRGLIRRSAPYCQHHTNLVRHSAPQPPVEVQPFTGPGRIHVYGHPWSNVQVQMVNP